MASGPGALGEKSETYTSGVRLSNRFNLNGRQVVLIDMPGFDETGKSEMDTLRSIATFLAST